MDQDIAIEDLADAALGPVAGRGGSTGLTAGVPGASPNAPSEENPKTHAQVGERKSHGPSARLD
jgi:hypothetical protein